MNGFRLGIDDGEVMKACLLGKQRQQLAVSEMRNFRAADDPGRRCIGLRAFGDRLSQRMEALVFGLNMASRNVAGPRVREHQLD